MHKTMAVNSMSVATNNRHHPPALRMLFFTEMWERFSYYGMRALLVIYLVNSQHYGRAQALALYATYTGLVYLTPIIGGYLADRYLEKRKAILIGGITMALGHFAMAFPSLLNLALGLLIIGNGFFKPNIGSLLGSLYQTDDPRRDGGFTIFYIGVNLGAFLSPLVAGTLGEKFGWHYGFASAGVGMCLGLAQFVYGQAKLGKAGLPVGQSALLIKDWMQIIFISLAMIPLVYTVVNVWAEIAPVWTAFTVSSKAITLVAAVSFLLIAGRSGSVVGNSQTQRLSRQEWHRIIYIAIMGFFVVFFWTGFEQAGGTMSLFADKQTDRFMFGWEVPTSYFQSINPLTIIVLGPGVAALWGRLDQSRFVMPTSVKMAMGMIILGVGFIVLAIAQMQASYYGKIGPQWLVLVYLLHTVGELCLSPVGLAMVTNLAPTRLAAMMLGIWYLANACANYLAGIMENLLLGTSISLYWLLVASSIGAGLLLLVISPMMNKLLKDDWIL